MNPVRPGCSRLLVAVVLLCLPASVHGQRMVNYLGQILQERVLSQDVTAAELQQYALVRISELPSGSTPASWTAEAGRLRERYLQDVVFRGWPDAWVHAPLRVEDLGLIPTGAGYRLRRIRFEVVPDLYCVALLYEPGEVNGRMPAVLNVNGHDRDGKAAEYKQRRCINQALRGMFALNIEFLGFGELDSPENGHQPWGPHLDLVGANAAGLFYLAMRKGLDYLYEHPHVDRDRIAVTGLSGGGWQTIVLSALDERVGVAIPVAGYASLRSAVESVRAIGDIEQTPTDMQTVLDYTHLTAMRAPKPTLLIYNKTDDCCFRAPLVKPSTYDPVKSFYELYAAPDRLEWFESIDPGYHNYQRPNREKAYRFLMDHFGIPGSAEEIRVDAEVRSAEELMVGLPPDNLTILGLARRMASQMERPPAPAEAQAEWRQEQRSVLFRILRAGPVDVETAFAVNNSHDRGIETISYRFRFDNGLSASAVWMREVSTPGGAPVTVLLNDRGKGASGAEAFERVFRGEQVLAVDLIFVGDAELPRPGNPNFARLIYTLGERPLGLQTGQLHALAQWVRRVHGASEVRVEASGMRSQVISSATAALHPGAFTEVVVRNGLGSLADLLSLPVRFESAPELFCFDLFRRFDLDRIEELCAPTRVIKRQ